jgi:hypothetical protein
MSSFRSLTQKTLESAQPSLQGSTGAGRSSKGTMDQIITIPTVLFGHTIGNRAFVPQTPTPYSVRQDGVVILDFLLLEFGKFLVLEPRFPISCRNLRTAANKKYGGLSNVVHLNYGLPLNPQLCSLEIVSGGLRQA